MSTSFNLNRNQLVTYALMLIGVVGAENTIASSDLQIGSDFLNMMVKNWEAEGNNLWARTEATLFLTKGQVTYQLGNGARAASTFVETTLTTTITSGTNSLIVGSVTGMTVGDILGIVDTTGSTQWTTIATLTPGTLTVTTVANITNGATATTNVYTYTSTITRPYAVTQCRYRTGTPGLTPPTIYDRELKLLAREDYYRLANKLSQGPTLEWYYDTQLTSSSLTVWPAPSVETDRINFTFLRPLSDLVNSTDTADLPQEYLLPIVYNLGVIVAPLYGKGLKVKQEGIDVQAMTLLRSAKGFNVDTGPTQFAPDLDLERPR